VEEVRFGLLGSLEVWTGALARPLFAARHRTLLASLLCRANQVVACDELADTIWDGHPPRGAAVTLRGYVMRVRRTLGTAGQRIETAASGYRINLDQDHELDTARFAQLCRCGLAAGSSAQWKNAAVLLDEALALWRGEPLQDVPSERLRDRELPGLLGTHVQAEQARLQAEIELGQPEAAVAGLGRLVAAHPLWERPCALLMMALDGCDLRAEALGVFRDLRARLIEELGIEPSRELQDLHRTILAGRRETVSARPPRRPDQAPFTLPAAVGDFAGREAEVECLLVHLAQTWTHQGAVSVTEITGMGGVGKTTLALHVAHLLRDRFPDGQLFGRLHGTGSRPAEPGKILAQFLRLLGVDPARVPADHEERAALYRSLLNGRRMLIFLDDVRDAAQVRPLLPASAGNAVLVTTQARITTLPAATRVDLDVLGPREARLLFERIVGAGRLTGEPEAVEHVLRACAGLPLAVRIAGARLAARPDWRVRDLAERLAPGRNRLEELSHGGDAVRAVFEAAYRGLSARADAPRAATWVFRALGLWPGPDLSLPAAATLYGLGEGETERALEFLVDVSMVAAREPGRYGLHDLLREYARELVGEELPHAAAPRGG
jgi:DNA-binding SARP family transcriptional activator